MPGGGGDYPNLGLGRPRPFPLPMYNDPTTEIMDNLSLRAHPTLVSTPTVEVDFLMPNSIIIQHKVSTSASLEEIKEVRCNTHTQNLQMLYVCHIENENICMYIWENKKKCNECQPK